MGELLGRCVGLVSGETWRSIREVTEVPFVHRKIPDHISAIKEHTERHFTELWKQKHLSQGQLHPAQDFKMLPFWIVAEVFYGKLTPELTEELKSLIPLREELFNYVIQGGLSRFSWTHFFPTKAGRALAEFKKRWESFNRAAYMHARDCKSNSTETHAPILSMYDAVSDDKITQDQLSQTIDESLFANLDVTIGGISWNPVFLAAYPTHQQRLRDEIRSLAPEDVDAYLQSSSTFLSACISESSRLKPLAAFSVPQSAPSDRVVGGYLIPAGTNFIVDSYALNVRNAFWGSEASTYRPDRFLEPKMRGLQLRYHFWRFGFGPRQCMGKYVADLIIRTLLVHLVKHFELSLEKEGEDGVWARSDSWITHPDFLIRCKEIKDTGEKAEVVG